MLVFHGQKHPSCIKLLQLVISGGLGQCQDYDMLADNNMMMSSVMVTRLISTHEMQVAEQMHVAEQMQVANCSRVQITGELTRTFPVENKKGNVDVERTNSDCLRFKYRYFTVISFATSCLQTVRERCIYMKLFCQLF